MSMQDEAHDRERWPAEAYGWYVVFVMCLCSIVAFVDRQIINLLVEDIKTDLQVTDTQIGLLQGLAFALFYAFAAIPLGRLADTGNRRIIITIGIAVWTAAAAACGLARSFVQLFVARTVVGVGEATLTPSGFSMLADYFRPARLSLPLAVMTGSSFFGSGIALLIGGYVIAQLGRFEVVTLPLLGVIAPWKAAFIIGALPGLFATLLFFFTVREPERRGSRADVAQQNPPLREVVGFMVQHRGVFGAVFLGVSVLAAVQFCLGAWVPAHFIRNLGWTAPEIGYAYGLIFLFCGTGGVISGGWFADRLLARGQLDAHLRVVRLSALLALPFVLAFPAMSSGGAAVALLAPAVFFGTMAFGAGPSLIPVICPPRMRGLLIAIYLLIANIVGQAGGPIIVALFTDRVFGAPELVRYSLMVAPSALLLLGAALVTMGFKGLREFRA
ncbi:MAG: MFS transporter [Gammaproteobacteria bacterium]|nr:MFS transporter [Gammaproteobacteria bacterium]